MRASRFKLSRKTGHRVAMLRNMVSSLIKYDRIKTTLPKARQARKLAEKVIMIITFILLLSSSSSSPKSLIILSIYHIFTYFYIFR